MWENDKNAGSCHLFLQKLSLSVSLRIGIMCGKE